MSDLTPEEKEIQQVVQQFIKRINTQSEGERVCVMCGQQIDAIRQTGRSVYARGVNPDACTNGEKAWRERIKRPDYWCRQYQGRIPDALKSIEE